MPLSYTATYDPDTDVGAVRAILQDVAVFEDAGDTLPDVSVPRAQWSVLFLDQEIQKKLDNHADAVNRFDLAAADLLEDAASNAALLSKILTLGSYTSNTVYTARDIRQQAAALRARYANAIASAANEPAESITEEIYTDFDWRRSIFQNLVRG